MRVFSPFVLILVLASLGSACLDAPRGDGAVGVPSLLEAGDSAAGPAGQCRPTLVALQRDRTGSALSTATPQITPEHLATFIDIIRECGGALAVGDICRRSFVPLTRIRIDQPPAAPVEPVWVANPYEQRQQLTAFQPVRRAFQEALHNRAAAIDADVEAFTAAASPRLSAPPTCNVSDVAGAVERSLLFLGEREPDDGWSEKPRKAIVLVSDAQHNAGRWDVKLPEDVEVVLVNGIGSRGALADAPGVQLFESLAAALRFLRPHR